MWRFLNNIPRALRQYIHSPRPSAGICNVDEDVSEQDVEQLAITAPVKHDRKILHGVERDWKNENKKASFSSESTQHDGSSRSSGEWGRWRACHQDFWKLLQGSHRLLETFTLGTAMGWGNESSSQTRQKLQLLYRVLFAVQGNPGTRAIREVSVDGKPKPQESHQAEATPEDNSSGPDGESLESVMEEYQALCTKHQACCESALGLQAYSQGDMDTALQHLRTACMMGNISACFNLGLCYETGSGVTQDLEKAKEYYNKAACGGHKGALYNLGLLYLGEAQPAGDGLSLVERAAEAGLAQAQIYMGVHHMEQTLDAQTAVEYFKAAAQQQDSEGQYFLGICHEQGWGVERDLVQAVRLYSEAARSGHDLALYNIGVCHENGIGGLTEDPETAKDFYTKAAQAGCVEASHRLEELRARDKLRLAMPQYPLDIPKSPRAALSPSASSPNLSLDWNLALSHSIFDPGGGNSATLDQMEDYDIFAQQKSLLVDKSCLRRSNTSPNLAMVTCNV